MAVLNSEITKSLNNIDKTKVDLPMLNTHVSRTPNGLERGRYLAIDFLGDEHKLAIVTFSSQLHRPHADVATFKLPNQYLSCSFGEVMPLLYIVLQAV
ncbi:Hexokinase [Taenia solium]|eukprot:TsM_000677600 transcript=TsM_000677600 gene=TsM_000677600